MQWLPDSPILWPHIVLFRIAVNAKSLRVPVDAVRSSHPPQQNPSPRPRAQRFVDVLSRAQKAQGPKRKGERTRDRLKIGAIQALEQRGYLSMRVTDICKRAKVSPAVFYLYFKNKRDITIEVLTEFLDSLLAHGGAGESHRSLYDAIYEANLTWVTSVRTNAGLMRCLLQLSDDEPAFKELSERKNHEWFQRVTHSLMRRFPRTSLDERSLLLAVYTLGGMMDEFSRKLLVAREAHLESLVKDIAPTDEALAEYLSVMWYRALFARNPAPVSHSASLELLRFSEVDPTSNGTMQSGAETDRQVPPPFDKAKAANSSKTDAKSARRASSKGK